jgi:hypothetical protein
MLATINSLSRKFDIVTYGTWRNVIDVRSKDVISPGDHESSPSIWLETLKTASPDFKFLRVLQDIETRIRDKINIITNNYYDNHKKGHKIKSSSATYTDEEGDKTLTTRISKIDSMITHLITDVVNANAFVDTASITKVSSQFPSVSPTLLRETLNYISMTASQQVMSRDIRLMIPYENTDVYVNVRTLVEKLVQISFRYLINNRISLSNKPAIWNALRNAYSSSRINDPQIMTIRNSIKYYVDQADKTKREATKSSLKIAVIMYVIFKCLAYL